MRLAAASGPAGHPLHAFVVPLPIGAFVSSLIFDILTWTRPGELPWLVDGAWWLIGVGMIDVVPGDLPVRGSIVIPDAELRWRFSRPSGPGGQGVNTTDSRVELSFDVARTTALGPTLKARALDRLGPRLVDGVLTISASEHRSQLRNREAAEARPSATPAEAIAPAPPPR